MTNMRTKFKNANEAYDYFLDKILLDGVDFDNTKALFNLYINIPFVSTKSHW